MSKQKILKALKRMSRYILIMFAAFLFSYAVRAFINKAGLLTGGVSGISLLISRYVAMIHFRTDLTSLLANQTQMVYVNTLTSIIYFTINIPILILAFRKMGKRFARLSALFIITNTFLIRFIPFDMLDIFNLEEQTLAYAIFAGLLTGSAVSIALNVGGSSGGAEVIATYLSRKKQVSIGKILMIVNAIIIVLGGILLRRWTPMLFTFVFIYVNGKTIDTLHRFTKKIQVKVITKKGDEIAESIANSTHYSSTRWSVIGGYSGGDKDLIMIVVPENLHEKIVYLVQEVDPQAFIMLSEMEKVHGNFYIAPLK